MKLRRIARIAMLGILSGAGTLVSGQQVVHVEVQPGSSRAIEGQLSLNRQKYFNVASSGTSIESSIGDQELSDYYFRELEMTLGRALGMVNAEVNWGNSVFEDPARPGYVDIPRLMNKLNPSNGGSSQDFINLIGPNQDVAFHENHDAYPDFMPKYFHDDKPEDAYPENSDAASELAVTLLQHKFTDWTRPAFYEPVNEPTWQLWSDPRFIEFHTSIWEKNKAAGTPVEVGGPCFSVGYHYKNKFASMGSVTSFMDRTDFKLDFYSWHIYDYLHWENDKFDFEGSVSTGLPTEGVFDAIANYTVNKYGRPFTYVASEHGGYISSGMDEDAVFDLIADKYFPGSGFAHTMEKRSIEDHLAVSSSMANTFTFMNNPHIVKKGVPFILIETASWGPDYDAVLLTPEDFVKGNPWYPTKRIHFYEFFKDVEGRRVLSHCADNDLQHHAFVDGNTLILIFNNQSNEPGNINLDIPESTGTIKDIRLRRFGRNPDLRPYLTEERLFSLDALEFDGREALALFIEYDREISQERILNEVVHYGDHTSSQFSGSKDFKISIPDFADVEHAVLRVGIGLDGTASKKVDISLNGTDLNIPVEDGAERFSGGDYGSTRIAKFDPTLLQAENTIRVNFPDGQEGGVGAVVIRAAYASTDTVSGIAIASDKLSLFTHQTDSLDVSFFPETTNERDLSWISLDPLVASVNPEGLITAISEGSTQIVALTADGFSSDTCEVSVWDQNIISMADKSGWKAIYADDEGYEMGMLKELAIDGDLSTYWHTEWKVDPLSGLPHEIWVDMGDTLSFDKFIYTPRQDQWGPNGGIGDYELYFSNDTSEWGAAEHSGTFSWDTENGGDFYYKEIKTIELGALVSARYFRLVALSEHQNIAEISHTAAAELDVATVATGVALLQDDLSLSMGSEDQLEVITLPLGSTAGAADFRWRSTQAGIASVMDGLVKGEGPGLAEIIVETFDGNSADTCQVNVSVIGVNEIRLSASTLEIMEGENRILTAEILPANAYYDSYTWISDNEEVATVDKGYVFGLAVGTANIIALSSDGIHADTCTLSVTTQAYDVEIRVLDEISGEALEGALVRLDGKEANSGTDGKALIPEVHYGNQVVEILMDRYQDYSLSLDIQGETQHDAVILRITHDLKITVREEYTGKPVPNADLRMNDDSGITGSDGELSLQHPWGSFSLSVEKEKFQTLETDLVVEKDSSYDIALLRLLADAKFRIRDSSGSVSGASIVLDDMQGLSSSLGIYTFKDMELESDRELDYLVSKEGYRDLSGRMFLLTDTTVEVTLQLASGSRSASAGELRLYPVPVSDILHIDLPSAGILRLYSTEGMLLRELRMEEGMHEMSMRELAPGMYLLKYNTDIGELVRLIPLSR